MRSAMTNHSVVTPPTFVASPRSVPTLNELYELASEPDQRHLISGVDWAFYEQLVDSIPEGVNIHVDYDGKDLEIMVLSPFHDGEKKLFGQLVEAVAQELEIPYKSAGRRPGSGRKSRAAWSRTKATSSEPKSWRQRPRRKGEDPGRLPTIPTPIWQSRSTSLLPRSIGRESTPRCRLPRSGDSTAKSSKSSSSDWVKTDLTMRSRRVDSLPIRAEEVRRWVVEEDSSDESAWARRLRAWARAEPIPRRPR